MERINVESSTIRSVGYDLERAILEIEFSNGNVYEYYDVPQYQYDALMNASSKGQYANQNIYKTYRQQKIA
jgi:hypothetical protein